MAQVRRPAESYMLRAMRARVLFPEHNTNRHVCNVYRHPFATMGTSNLVHERPLGQGYDDWKSSVASKQRAVSTLSLPEHGPLGLVHSARQMSCESASTFMTIADATTAPLRTNTDDNAYRLHRLLACVWSRHAGPQLQEHTSVLLIGTPGRNARFTLVPIYPPEPPADTRRNACVCTISLNRRFIDLRLRVIWHRSVVTTPTPDHPHHQQTFHVQLLRFAYPDSTNIEAGTHSVWPATEPAPTAGGA